MTSPPRLKVAAWLVGGLTTSLAVASVVVAIADPVDPSAVNASGVALASYEAFVYASLGGLGAVVSSRHPRNVVGWMLQLIALALALTALGNHVYDRGLSADRAVTDLASLAGWSVSWLWIFAIVPAFTLFPLLFPTGRPLSPRWRPIAWIAIAAGVMTWFGTAFLVEPIPDYPGAVSPVGIDSPAVEVIGLIGFGVLVPTALASIASVIIRFRRSTGVEREQLKWVAAAAALLPLAFLVSGVGGDDSELSYVILLSALLVLGMAVAVAMLRYRLYDINVVINRTVVYGALTGTLVAAYVLGVLLLQFALGPLTERNDLAVAGSTLAVAALFRPARARIQRWVDRRFYRTRYDATRTLGVFTTGLRDQVDLATLGRDLRSVVHTVMQPTHVGLWLRER